METETKNTTLTWEAPEFVHYPKSPVWFIVLSIIGVALILFFLFKGDFLTSTLFALLLIVTLYFSRQKPRKVKIKITGNQLQINEVKIPFDQIKGFWIIYNPPEIKALNFETTAYLNRYVTVQLADENPLAIREFLLNHLVEDMEKTEPLTDKISRKIGF
jgi:hypothetical protein